MKGLAAIGVAGLIAAVGALWLSAQPNVVFIDFKPMSASPDLPSFEQMQERALRQQNSRN